MRKTFFLFLFLGMLQNCSASDKQTSSFGKIDGTPQAALLATPVDWFPTTKINVQPQCISENCFIGTAEFNWESGEQKVIQNSNLPLVYIKGRKAVVSDARYHPLQLTSLYFFDLDTLVKEKIIFKENGMNVERDYFNGAIYNDKYFATNMSERKVKIYDMQNKNKIAQYDYLQVIGLANDEVFLEDSGKHEFFVTNISTNVTRKFPGPILKMVVPESKDYKGYVAVLAELSEPYLINVQTMNKKLIQPNGGPPRTCTNDIFGVSADAVIYGMRCGTMYPYDIHAYFFQTAEDLQIAYGNTEIVFGYAEDFLTYSCSHNYMKTTYDVCRFDMKNRTIRKYVEFRSLGYIKKMLRNGFITYLDPLYSSVDSSLSSQASGARFLVQITCVAGFQIPLPKNGGEKITCLGLDVGEMQFGPLSARQLQNFDYNKADSTFAHLPKIKDILKNREFWASNAVPESLKLGSDAWFFHFATFTPERYTLYFYMDVFDTYDRETLSPIFKQNNGVVFYQAPPTGMQGFFALHSSKENYNEIEMNPDSTSYNVENAGLPLFYLDQKYFHWTYYLRHYPELIQAGIKTELAAREHWETIGIVEGRKAHWNIDVKDYLNYNPDLKTRFGTNYAAALEYYARQGYREGRVAVKPEPIVTPTVAPPAPPTPVFLRSDFDKDGSVNAKDLNILKIAFGGSGSNLTCDIDKDGKVSVSDLTIFKAEFGH